MSGQNPDMDKSISKGIRPGSGSGAVKSYNAKRNPFGGYIVDSASGVDLFVHKSEVEKAGLAKLEAGQHLTYRIVEDGFGGFKAIEIAPS